MSKRKKNGRVINGILLFDKPEGESSNRSLQKVKRIFNAAKAGHTGTLDPLATGLLAICFGRATKISNYLLASDKKYEVVLKLGVTTDTGDVCGKVLEYRDAQKITEQQITTVANQLTGNIEQIPPMYSALKHQGKRLYKLARQGIEVPREARKVQIHAFEFLKQQHDVVSMRVHCSKGTYVRTLVEDLGKQLACGAHVLQLRRTALGPFDNPNMYTFENLEMLASKGVEHLDKTVIPTDQALLDWPLVTIAEEQMQDMLNGQAIEVSGQPESGNVRIYNMNQQFYGIGTIRDDGKMVPKPLN